MPHKERSYEQIVRDMQRWPLGVAGVSLVLFQYLSIYILLYDRLIHHEPMDILNHIVAPLIVAAALGGFSWIWAKMRIQQKIDAAPRQYVQELDKLIQRAVSEGEENAILNARAIVATRNSLRGSLISISSQLNSEIDRLAEDIGETIPRLASPSEARQTRGFLEARRAFETIQVLARTWPAKREQIEVEIRKLLAELGLDFRKSSQS